MSQMYWTIEVHEAIRNGVQGIKDYYDKLQSQVSSQYIVKYYIILCVQLSDIVEIVRGKLPKQTRTTLGALVVIDVHARDTVQELIDKGSIVNLVTLHFVVSKR